MIDPSLESKACALAGARTAAIMAAAGGAGSAVRTERRPPPPAAMVKAKTQAPGPVNSSFHGRG